MYITLFVYIILPEDKKRHLFIFGPQQGGGEICAAHICAYFAHISDFFRIAHICAYLRIFCAYFTIFRGRPIKIIVFGWIFLDLQKFLDPSKDKFFFEKIKMVPWGYLKWSELYFWSKISSYFVKKKKKCLGDEIWGTRPDPIFRVAHILRIFCAYFGLPPSAYSPPPDHSLAAQIKIHFKKKNSTQTMSRSGFQSTTD